MLHDLFSSLETGRSSPDNQAPVPEAEPGDVGEGHHRKRSSPPPVHTKESKTGYGGIRDLIRKFQGHVEEVSEKSLELRIYINKAMEGSLS